MIEKIWDIYLIKSYDGEDKNDGEDRKYSEVPMVKYMILPKCGTKYQKVRPNINLI